MARAAALGSRRSSLLVLPFRSPLHRARPREELPAWRFGDGPQNGRRTGGGWHGRRCLWAEGRVKWGAQMEEGSQQRTRARGCERTSGVGFKLGVMRRQRGSPEGHPCLLGSLWLSSAGDRDRRRVLSIRMVWQDRPLRTCLGGPSCRSRGLGTWAPTQTRDEGPRAGQRKRGRPSSAFRNGRNGDRRWDAQEWP